MIESPLIQELMAQKGHHYILQVLEVRFGAIPPEVALALRTVMEDEKLDELNRFAATCPDVESFYARLGVVQ